MKHSLPKYILKQTIVWICALFFWALMRNFGIEVERPFEVSFIEHVYVNILIGVVAGALFGSLEFLVQKYLLNNVPLGVAMLIGSASYLVFLVFLIGFGARAFTGIVGEEYEQGMVSDWLLSKEGILFIAYAFGIGFISDLFTQMNRKFGPGNLLKMIKGEFYSPKEEDRIFMFLDLKSSTAIAERLGHIEYSKLIQDCFRDLAVVTEDKAEIYQYVGDEVVLTWEVPKGLNSFNCLMAYFRFIDKIQSKSSQYIEKYGVIPEFKAGLNMGKVTVAEVGEIKREIAYHGDAINVASRIQHKCNEFGENILISENLYRKLSADESFSFGLKGEELLKGKKETVKIYGVSLSDGLKFEHLPSLN